MSASSPTRSFLPSLKPRIEREIKRRNLSPPSVPTNLDNRITLRDLRILHIERGEIVPLVEVWNPVQDILLRELGLDPDDPYLSIAGLRWRKRILKARRPGVTTAIMALFFLDTYNNEERYSVSMAHSLNSAERIFEINHRFYRFLPPEKKRKAGRANVRELFWPETNSLMQVATAFSDDTLSGSTCHNLHKSERAKWPGTESQIQALDASLDIAAKYGNIVEETTAKGINFFYRDWHDEESRYQHIFIPWFQDPRNVTDPAPGFKRTEEEEHRAQVYELNDAQLQWYRDGRKEHRDLMPQEYPHSPEEAFIASGNPRFRRDVLWPWLAELKTPALAPEKVEENLFSGILTTYVAPEEGHEYICIVDTAKGLTPSGDPDYTVAHWYDLESWEQVAHYRGRMETHDAGDDLNAICTDYNLALIAVETPGPGESLLTYLIHVIHYVNIYYFQDLDNPAIMKQPGFPMNLRTKPECDADLASLIEARGRGEPSIEFRHPYTLEELIRYVKLGGGKCGGENGSHDDEATCAKIAARLLPIYTIRGREQFAKYEREVDEEPVFSGARRLR